MAATDTIAGQVRVFKSVRLGHGKVVAGPFRSARCDKDAIATPIVLNPDKEQKYASGTQLTPAPLAVFHEGEILEVQFDAAALAEACQFDADEFAIDCIEEDLNTGDLRMRTLSVADQALAADFTTKVGTFVTGFKYTIPTRQKLTLSGVFQAAAGETA